MATTLMDFSDILKQMDIISPPVNKELASLSRSKMEKEDSVCSDYSLSDIEDGLELDTPELNLNGNTISSSKLWTKDLSLESNFLDFSDNYTRGVPPNQIGRWSDSSGISLQDSPVSTMVRSPRQSGVFESPSKTPAILFPKIDVIGSEVRARYTTEKSGITKMIDMFDESPSSNLQVFNEDSSKRHHSEPTEDSESNGEHKKMTRVVKGRKVLTRERSMSQGDPGGDKNNNNNELTVFRTLPKQPSHRIAGNPTSAQWKLYNRAMETYRKSAEKNAKPRSTSDASEIVDDASCSNETSISNPVSKTFSQASQVSLPRSSGVVSLSGSSVKTEELKKIDIDKPEQSFGPICPPNQQKESSPMHNALDYKTILRRTRSKRQASRTLVNPAVLQNIQDNIHSDDELSDTVTDIDSFLCFDSGESKPRRISASPSPEPKYDIDESVNDINSKNNHVKAACQERPKSPEVIVWSGLKVLAEKKKLSLQAAKSNVLTRLQKMSLKTGSVLSALENEKKENNLRKNAIITKRNKSVIHHTSQSNFIYLDPASHNGCNMISSFGQYHTVASPARLSRMRKKSLTDCLDSATTNRQFWELEEMRTSHTTSQSRMARRAWKNNRSTTNARENQQNENSLPGDTLAEDASMNRRLSVSLSDLTVCHESKSFMPKRTSNICVNNNNSRTCLQELSPRKSPARRAENRFITSERPNDLVIDLNNGTCNISKSSENKKLSSSLTNNRNPPKLSVPKNFVINISPTHEKKKTKKRLPGINEDSTLHNAKTESHSTGTELKTFKMSPKHKDKLKISKKKSYNFNSDPLEGALSEDMSKLDWNIEEYFSFLSGSKSKTSPSPCSENSVTLLSVNKSVSNFESNISEPSSTSTISTPSLNSVECSPEKKIDTVKRRRRKNNNRAGGVPSFIPDYIKPAYGKAIQQTNAKYQLNILDKSGPDEDDFHSMESFIKRPSVQKCRRNSIVGQSRTWSGRVSERNITKAKSKFGSLSIAKLLKANRLKLAIGGYCILFYNFKLLSLSKSASLNMYFFSGTGIYSFKEILSRLHAWRSLISYCVKHLFHFQLFFLSS